jgi:hypothetical protein
MAPAEPMTRPSPMRRLLAREVCLCLSDSGPGLRLPLGVYVSAVVAVIVTASTMVALGRHDPDAWNVFLAPLPLALVGIGLIPLWLAAAARSAAATDEPGTVEADDSGATGQQRRGPTTG